jgi:hypothetical protein
VSLGAPSLTQLIAHRSEGTPAGGSTSTEAQAKSGPGSQSRARPPIGQADYLQAVPNKQCGTRAANRLPRTLMLGLRMSGFTEELKNILVANKCRLVRGYRLRETWESPISKRRFIVDNNIKSRHIANAVLRQAGLPKAF